MPCSTPPPNDEERPPAELRERAPSTPRPPCADSSGSANGSPAAPPGFRLSSPAEPPGESRAVDPGQERLTNGAPPDAEGHGETGPGGSGRDAAAREAAGQDDAGTTAQHSDDETPDDPTSHWGPTTRRVEELLEQARKGDEGADAKLLKVVYPQLRAIADRLFRGQDPSHTLQATALVHEAFLKYVNRGAGSISDAEHLYRLMGKAMRQVLTDHARRKQRLKRPQSTDRVRVDMSLLLIEEYEERAGDLEILSTALDNLAARHPHLAEQIELHFFASRSHEEIAELIGTSVRESQRRSKLAKGFIKREIERLSK
jgi:RNA polymerase sigma-70 factor (ECF subfamily)